MAALALKLMAFANQNHNQSDPYTSSLTTAYGTSIIPTLSEVSTSFILTDPSLPNHPIIFASQSFVATSGFQNDELIGRNARMFQGPKTDRRAVMEIRESVRSETPIQISLVNYKKDGSWFWVLLHLCPVFDSVGSRRVLHFLGLQVPLDGKRDKKVERLYGSCREDVRGVGLDINLFEDVDKRGLEAEESCKANDLEKEKAAFEANNILAILSYYRKHVIEKKCSLTSITPLNSSLNISLGRIKQSFVLTDPYLADVPIVYASDSFLNLTGYTKQEVLGRNCRFLTGPGTDVNTLHEITASIKSKQSCGVRLLNYRKDGSPFWNLLYITPVRNATGKIAFMVEVQISESSKDVHGVSTKMRQMSVVAAVKVAARSLCGNSGPSSRSTEQ